MTKSIYYIILFICLVVLTVIWGQYIHKRYIKKEQFNGTAADTAETSSEDPACKTEKEADELQKPFDLNLHYVAANETLRYANTSDQANPWTHHDVQGSLPIDPIVKFPKAYYYELDNKKYTDGLRKALVVSCSLIAEAVSQSNWSDSYTENANDSDAKDAYNACLREIAQKLNSSDALALPGEADIKKTKIQVVHDILRGYQRHKDDPDFYLLNIELVLYRENKVHGKHVLVTATVKKKTFSWLTNIIAVTVLGVVPEDQIGIFPVVANNPYDTNNLLVADDVPPANLNGITTCTQNKTTNKLECTVSPAATDAIATHNTTYANYAETKLALGELTTF